MNISAYLMHLTFIQYECVNKGVSRWKTDEKGQNFGLTIAHLLLSRSLFISASTTAEPQLPDQRQV